MYDYGTWSMKQERDAKNLVLEKPPIFFSAVCFHTLSLVIMKDLTIYSAFLENTEDEATQSV